MKIIKLFLISLIAVCVLSLAITVPHLSGRFGDTGTGNRFTSMTVSGFTTANTTSVALAKNSGRQFARFQNDDGTINMWLCLAATCTANTGIKLTPGASYTIDLSNLYVGDVSVIAASSTPVLDITTNP